MAAAKSPAVKAVARLTLIAGAAALQKNIASIAKRAATLDKEIHLCAVSVIAHTAKHNDPDTSTRLVEALGKTMRKQALIAWMLNYGAFKQDDDGKLVYDVKRRDAVLDDANIAAAEAEPFWEFMPEKPYVQFDLNKAITALLKKAEHALETEQQDAALVQPDKLAALRSIVKADEPQAE